MSKHDKLIAKYQKNQKTVSLSIGGLGLFKAVIKEFDESDDQVVIESRDDHTYPGLTFACHKDNVLFLVKS